MLQVNISDDLFGKDFIELAFTHCIKCSTCKYSFKEFTKSCPSGENFLFESFWASGRIRTLRGILLGDLELHDTLKDSIFACTTCGACMDSCQAPHADFIVDIIESLREITVRNIGPAKNQEKLFQRIADETLFNPYGEMNSTNEDLKKKYELPDKAEWVYFIGCTSNYRQRMLRDSTLEFLKKAHIEFTLVDEHCCTSPLLRTGQLELSKEFMKYNKQQIEKVGAKKVITSCAGCYRTLKKDSEKFNIESNFRVYHITELIEELINSEELQFKSSFNQTVTYHDPCHLGRHMKIYEIPREILKSIPGIEVVEMERNRNFAWCCGAGGGVKIGYPEWALEISNERLIEAKNTGANVIVSTCPFCKTNLTDANQKFNFDFEILDLIEIINSLDFEIKNPD